MIYFFTPYSFDFKLLDAITGCMELLNPDDWAVLMDGDTMFLQPDFGHRIQKHIETHPEAGLFTCYASRCHYSIHVPKGVDMVSDSIRYHKLISNNLAVKRTGEAREINRRIAGHLMVIRKSTWSLILPTVLWTAGDKKDLGVDTKISKAVLASGLKILLMEDIYLLYYCRLPEGFDYTDHLTLYSMRLAFKYPPLPLPEYKEGFAPRENQSKPLLVFREGKGWVPFGAHRCGLCPGQHHPEGAASMPRSPCFREIPVHQ